MIGRLETDQGQFFYEHSLEKLFSADHLVRKLSAVLDLSWPRDEPAPAKSPMVGRFIEARISIV